MSNFTEEELTQMAVLKSQSLNKENAPGVDINIPEEVSPVQPAPKAEPKAEPKKEPKKVVKTLEKTISDKFPHKLELGNNKTVHYTNWTGKTKKIFNKLLDTKGEDISVEDISRDLIREYIQEQDIYLSPLEEQYLIVKIRDISLDDKYTYSSMCPECDFIDTITDKTSNIFKYKKSKFPKKIGDINFVDIESFSKFTQTVSGIQTAATYDGLSTEADIEIAMHIDYDNKTPIEVMDYIDTLSLRDISQIIDSLSSVSPDLSMGVKKVCPECKTEVFFEAEEIPNVFEELI